MNFGERFDTEVFDPCRQSADCPADHVCIPFFVDPPRSDGGVRARNAVAPSTAGSR
jgi:hypothetical protein